MINKILGILFFFTIISNISSEKEVDLKWCYPEEAHSHLQICECNEENIPPWGERTLTIDCNYKNLHNNELESFGFVLPLYTSTLDVSWNQLSYLPSFNGDTLRALIASHNNITRINENNFMDLPNLKELDLSWNEISIISLNAFYKLGQLTKLNLSHNKLKFIPSGVFYFVSTLETISLSWNTELYQQKDFMKSNLFSQFGLSSKLKELKLDNCNLDNLDLSSGKNLQHLSIRSNKFKNIPDTTPTSLKYLDISDNPISSLQPLGKKIIG